MKKAITLLLALVLMLSLAACGSSGSDTISSTDLVGYWKSGIIKTDGAHRQIVMWFAPTQVFDLTMLNWDNGGNQDPAFKQSGSWSITDEGILITYYSQNGIEMKYTIKYNAKKDTLTNGKFICEKSV